MTPVKKTFSYQTDLFGQVLAASLIGHVMFLGAGGLLHFTPEFAVREAPSSVEVVILKTKEVKPEIQEKVITTNQVTPVKEQIFQKKENAKPVQKPVVSPEVKGAIREAQPDYFKNPAPVYPRYAREQGWEGLVILEVLVEKDGRAGEVKILASSGYSILDDAARDAIKKWQFSPARIGSLSFSSRVKIPVRFVLTEESRYE